MSVEQRVAPAGGAGSGSPPVRTGDSAAGAHDTSEESGDGRERSFLMELPFLVVGALVLVVLVRAFLFMFFYIPSGSMERTLMCNDRVIVNRLAYAGAGPSRGDVIVFRQWSNPGDVPPPESAWSFLGQSIKEGVPFLDSSKAQPDLIKRVIGLPGDTVEARDSHAYVNGRKLNEPYVFLNGPDGYTNFGPVTVPQGQYLVLGDHRNDSADSRAQTPGGKFVDRDDIVGRALLRVWPPSHWGNLRGAPQASAQAALCPGEPGGA